MEEVRNYRLVSEQVFVPRLLRRLFFRPAFVFSHFDIRLLTFAVEIFSEQVEHGVDAFVRVMLAVALELRSVFSEDAFEQVGTHNTRVLVPHLIHKLGPSHHEPSFSAKRVFLSLMLDKLEPSIKEEFGEFIGVAEALDA
jgi:hypothetical protein